MQLVVILNFPQDGQDIMPFEYIMSPSHNTSLYFSPHIISLAYIFIGLEVKGEEKGREFY